MWSAERAAGAARRLAGGMVLLSLGGCGFHPLYANRPGGIDAAQHLAEVRVDQIPERVGVLMTDRLRDSFNPDAAGVPPRWVLHVVPTETAYDQAIRPDGTSSRTVVVLRAQWSLSPIAGGTPLATGTISYNSAFDLPESNDYTDIASKADTEARLVREVADDLQTRVVLALHKRG